MAVKEAAKWKSQRTTTSAREARDLQGPLPGKPKLASKSDGSRARREQSQH